MTRVADPVRREILELLQLQPPKTYRQIEDHFAAKGLKVTAKVITRVKEEAGLPVRRAPPAPAAAPLPVGGDGLSDLQPPPRAAQQLRSAAGSAAGGAAAAAVQQCPHCHEQWLLQAGEGAPRNCPVCQERLPDGVCGACGEMWILGPGEAQPRACPTCGAGFS